MNIAIALTSDAFRDQFDTALLVSGDSDLTGPVLQIKQLFPAKRIVVAFPPARSSARLLQEAHAAFTISRKTLKDSQFPDRIMGGEGVYLTAKIPARQSRNRVFQFMHVLASKEPRKISSQPANNLNDCSTQTTNIRPFF
ncbi:hypothetical protein SBA1_660003 [Candidatus Sulfotelmatobacter kueseliae]|uniref:Uncharacterized protein n=1 Tax=Candidatus Sulfotelmatobacter kueseliae TaxID=2042962 RepID=A0A2U3L3W0_9BACT|nr:hypothetical protein SBA1_660003 [Candidatus Sulfotelmatobacter kueseliae]